MKTSQIAAFTTNQIANGLSTAQIVALTTAQAGALTSAQTAALTTAQVRALETADLAAMKTSQIGAFTTNQVANGLSTAQIAALTTAQAAALSTAAVAALTTTQVAALETADLAALRTAQIGALTTAQVAVGLSLAQLGALTTSQVASFTATQVQALTTAQVAGLSTGQAASLTTTQIQALTTTQVAALETRDVVALTTSQIASFTTAQILNGLSTTQVGALTTTQVEALTAAQIGAMSTAQIQQLNIGSPIVLDLNGDGVHTRSISAGVQFDLFASGDMVETGWVDGTDGLLAIDRNGDGVINDGSELFGTSTRLANGQAAADGYAALRELDGNRDGIIDAQDASYANLRVWVDTNADGISSGSELHTLASLDIASVNAEGTRTSVKDAGNWIGMESSFTRTDGSTAATADVWFTAQKTQSVTAVETGSLRHRVGGLVQAMASFSTEATSAPVQGLTSPDLSGAAVQTGMMASIGSMVDVMKQFDSNGGQIPFAVTQMASTAESLAKTTAQPALTGLLTANGGLR